MEFKIAFNNRTIKTLVSIIALSFFAIFIGCNKEEECIETMWYQDNDNDGLGNAAIGMLNCDQPEGYVDNNTDTDDTQAILYDQNLQHELNSIILSESYPLRIFLPGTYETNKNLPVLYLLDGKHYYEDVIKYIKQIEFDAIIVGIGSHLADGNFDLRSRDFLPGLSHDGVVGGHLKFYTFLTEEVIPYIDSNYENDHNSRSLIGHHAAGLFTNFSLLHEAPENSFFSGFLSMNAELLNSEILINLAENLEFSLDAENIKLHISQVSVTMKLEWFNELLEEEAFPWLEIDFLTVVDESFSAFNPAVEEPSIKQGLKFIYNF